jgi:hypothetical protein
MCHFKSAQILFFVAIIFFISSSGYAQAPDIIWQHCYGGSYNDWGYAIVKSHDPGEKYVFAGGTVSQNGDVYGRYGDASDAWIGQIDNRDKMWWQKCLGGFGADHALSIIKTADGGYAVCGWTYSNDGDFSNKHGSGYTDAFVAKLDFEGKKIWGKCFGGIGTETAYSIIEVNDESRDIIMCAITNSIDGDVSGLHNIHDKNNDVWIVRISSEGKTRWQKCFGGSGSEGYGSSSCLTSTKDGGFAFASLTGSNDGDVSGNHQDSVNHNTADFWIVKCDGSGNTQWQKCFGGSAMDNPSSIIQTSDGGYAIAGSTSSDDGDASGLHANDSGVYSSTDAWIIKLNSSGSLQWQRCIGGGNQDYAASIIQISNGDYVVSGQTYSNNGDVSGNHGGGDAWVIRIGSDGALKWQRCYGGKNSEGASSILKTSDGGYIFVGTTYSNDGDIFGAYEPIIYGDIWIVRLDSDIVASSVNNNNNFISEEIKVFPNPSSTEVHFSLNANFRNASFYDIMGRQYFPPYRTEGNTVICNVNDLLSGMYTARLGLNNISFIVRH